MITWETLRDLCSEAGIAEDFARFELALPVRFINALMVTTGSAARYNRDLEFRQRVDAVVAIIMAELLEATGPADQTRDIEDLKKVFDEEVKHSRG